MKSFNRISRLASRGGLAVFLALLGASAAAAGPVWDYQQDLLYVAYVMVWAGGYLLQLFVG